MILAWPLCSTTGLAIVGLLPVLDEGGVLIREDRLHQVIEQVIDLRSRLANDHFIILVLHAHIKNSLKIFRFSTAAAARVTYNEVYVCLHGKRWIDNRNSFLYIL